MNRQNQKNSPGVFGRFRSDESATVTVEGVLWLPIFVLIFGLMVDASLLFNGQSKVLRIVQDANRKMSIDAYTLDPNVDMTTQVQDYINSRLAVYAITPSSTVAVASNAAVLTTVTIPADQFIMLGYFASLINLEVTVTHGHVLEGALDADFATLTSTL